MVKIIRAAPKGSSSSPSLGQLFFFSPLPTPNKRHRGCNHNAEKGANHTIEAGRKEHEGSSSDNTGDRSHFIGDAALGEPRSKGFGEKAVKAGRWLEAQGSSRAGRRIGIWL